MEGNLSSAVESLVVALELTPEKIAERAAAFRKLTHYEPLTL